MNDPLSSERRAQLRRERDALKSKHGEFFEKIAALMFEHDPIGINFEFNTDEYEPEAGTVIPRIEQCSTESELVSVLHEEFVRWFGSESAGPAENYRSLAQAIWAHATSAQWPVKQSAA